MECCTNLIISEGMKEKLNLPRERKNLVEVDSISDGVHRDYVGMASRSLFMQGWNVEVTICLVALRYHDSKLGCFWFILVFMELC